MRTPSKLVDSPEQMPVLFEIEAAGAAGATASSSSALSGSGAAAATEARLSYLLSGPGVSKGWKPVPAVARADWDAIVQNSTVAADGGGSGSGSGGGGDYVWGLQLESLDDGEYRLEVGGGGGRCEVY